MRLTDILLKEHILLPVKSTDRDSCIKDLIALLHENKMISEMDQAYSAVMDREKIMTTGVGNGIAIPHCKHHSCPNFAVALGVHPKGVGFDSIDKKNVKIIFLLVGPENNPGMHIKLLSRISRLMSNEDLREQILGCKTIDQLLQVIKEEENYYFDLD